MTPDDRDRLRELAERATPIGGDQAAWDAFCDLAQPEAVLALLDDLRDARAACEVTVREMERYYRDGSHPDLSPVLRAPKAVLAPRRDGRGRWLSR